MKRRVFLATTGLSLALAVVAGTAAWAPDWFTADPSALGMLSRSEKNAHVVHAGRVRYMGTLALHGSAQSRSTDSAQVVQGE